MRILVVMNELIQRQKLYVCHLSLYLKDGDSTQYFPHLDIFKWRPSVRQSNE